MLDLLQKTLGQVWHTFAGNWPYLVLGALVAAALKLYVDQAQVERWVKKYKRSSIFASTAIAVSTPLCSCGTMAVILGMMASSLSWAPVVAFMVASPLSSPEQFLYSAGLLGWPFATTFFVASIVLGVVGGFVAMLAENRGWLANQARFQAPQAALPIAGGSVDDLALPVLPTTPSRPGLKEYAAEVLSNGRRLLLLLLVFAFVGYLLNNLIPASIVSSLFGSGTTWGVPLAASFGLPLYFNTEASMPLIKAFVENGASEGAALAFLITGAGTSVGAITGALTIARWRVVGIVIGTLWVGAVILGYLYNALQGAL